MVAISIHIQVSPIRHSKIKDENKCSSPFPNLLNLLKFPFKSFCPGMHTTEILRRAPQVSAIQQYERKDKNKCSSFIFPNLLRIDNSRQSVIRETLPSFASISSTVSYYTSNQRSYFSLSNETNHIGITCLFMK